jgi:predicted glutamine amidotransferase
MCRMLGLVAAQAVSARDLLHDAPRSLRTLAHAHPDGWGAAFRIGGAWRLERGTRCAATCADYERLASTEAHVVVAHIRKRTVGPISLTNTHPFRRGELVFAHNGTVHAVDTLAARTAPEHLGQVQGDTDSERLFAFIETQIAEAGDIERGVRRAVQVLHELGDIGAVTFLLSCGARIYAHRLGRTLFTSKRGNVAIVASEQLDDSAWHEVAERELIVVEGVDTLVRHPAAA